MPASLAVLAVLLGVVAVSMVVYAARRRGPDPDAVRRGSRFLLGLGDFLVHWFMWVVGPAERLALRLGLKPDVFNFAGLGFGAASGALIAAGRLELGGWAITLGGVCDILDGRIARATRTASAYGSFIDSTLDRFVEVFALLGFLFYLRGFAAGPLAAAAALAGSLLVSYTRARGESVGVTCREGLMQRAERLVLMSVVCWLDGPFAEWRGWRRGTLAVWVLGVIAVGTFGTAIQRTVWIARRLRRLSGRRARVAVVSAQAESGTLLGLALDDSGYETTVLGEGHGPAQLAEVEADVMILDLETPGLDCWTVLKKLDGRPDPPSVVLTSAGGAQAHDGPLGEAVAAYVQKPFRIDELIEVCGLILAARAARRDPHQERRRVRRRPLVVGARILTPAGDALALGRITDLSPAGAQVDLGAPLHPGRVVGVAFELPGSGRPFTAGARVQWRQAGRVGLSFVPGPDDTRWRLAEALASPS